MRQGGTLSHRDALNLLSDAQALRRQLAESTAREAALREALRVIATQSLHEEDEHSDALKDIIDAAREVALQALAALEEKPR